MCWRRWPFIHVFNGHPGSCPRATQQIICSNEAGILCLSLLVMGTTLFISASESHAGSP